MKRIDLPGLALLLKALGKKAHAKVSLAPYTTLKIGGPAEIFYPVRRERDLIKAVKLAQSLAIPWFLLGGGSNLLINDQGFPGLVIHNQIGGIKVNGPNITAGSGLRLENLIETAISHGLGGIEKMAGIPGTVGGALFGNAGAYGQSISDCLLRVKVFDGKTVYYLDKEGCQFSYRETGLKKKGLVILEAEFQFLPASEEELRKTAQEIINRRSLKFPKELNCPGSFFKNVVLSQLSKETLKKIPKEATSHGKVAAGFLLEVVGAKGKQRGGIKIASYHGNLFYNRGNGRAKDFFLLAKQFQKKVKAKFNIVLEPEVQLIGFAKKF